MTAGEVLFSVIVFITLRQCFYLCLLATFKGKGSNYCHKRFRIDGQSRWYHASRFAMWQHPAMGHRMRLAVTGTNC